MSANRPLHHLALVPESSQLTFNELARVAAALQKQVSRDLAPIWGINATVSAFANLDDVPIDYWPIIIVDDVKDAAGVHTDKDGHPFALAENGPGWSLTASHEALEMLCDPFGSETRAGASPMPNQERVEFLVEVCDPPESEEFAYSINGVLVSDFYTPQFFDPKEIPGVRYDFVGAIKKPRQVLKGGYLSWHDPVTDHWFQQIFFEGDSPTFRDLGQLTMATGKSIRRQIYEQTPQSFKTRVPPHAFALTANGSIGGATKAGATKATALRSQVNTLLGKAS